MTDMDISIIIPLLNEKDSLEELAGRIDKSLSEKKLSYEVIFVDDGSTDGSWDEILRLAKENKAIHGIRFRRNYGKSAALYSGFRKAEGDVVVTMDADLQDFPEEVPQMYEMIRQDNWDIVSGWKQHRQDNAITKNLPSKLYNATARKITGIRLHDMNCGLKAYKKEVVKDIEVYGEMHRYIPYLAKNAGYARITEKPTQHAKRKFGKSKFGMNRFVNGFLDLLSLWFLSTFGKKPMHFFGYSGIFTFLIGFILTIWVIADKLVAQGKGLPYRPVTDQPLFFLALLAIVIGVLFFLAGFIGELIARSSSERNRYNIRSEF